METPFDYFFNDRTNPRTIEALKGGPLASALEAYAQRLHEDGYATHSGFVQLRLLGCFNRWLDRKGLTSEDVDAATIEQYLRGRAQSRKLRKGDSAALFRLLTILRPDRIGRGRSTSDSQLKPRWGSSSSTCDRNAVCPRRR